MTHTAHHEPRKLARLFDPGTSHASALMAGQLVRDHQAVILAALQQASDALGAEQVASWCGLNAYQVRKRLPELQTAGLAEPVGTRRASTGRLERTWRLVVTPKS